MAVLLAAVLFLFFGLWIAFRLPGWEVALGISRLPEERKVLLDSARLRKSLAAVFFAFSAVFFAFLLSLVFRVLLRKTALSLCFLALAVFFDVVVIIYRRFDSAEYSLLSRCAGLIGALCVNILLLGLSFVLLSL